MFKTDQQMRASLLLSNLETKSVRKRTPVNHDFFKTWTAEMAYVFGYWMADGNISSQESGQYIFTLTSNDQAHLAKVRDAMESDHKIYYQSHKSYRLMNDW